MNNRQLGVWNYMTKRLLKSSDAP